MTLAHTAKRDNLNCPASDPGQLRRALFALILTTFLLLPATMLLSCASGDESSVIITIPHGGPEMPAVPGAVDTADLEPLPALEPLVP